MAIANPDHDPVISCSLCSSGRISSFFEASDADGRGDVYRIFQCGDCEAGKTTPVPDQALLDQAYEIDYYGGESAKFFLPIEAWTRLAARRRARRLISRLGGHKDKRLRILDVGCGRGLLIDAFRVLGHDATGLERENSPFGDHPGVVLGDVSEQGFTPHSFDLIVLWHVLEHLPDPAAMLRQLAKLLTSEGAIVVAVPNFTSAQSVLFRANWFHLDLPRHLYHLSPKALEGILRDQGLRIAGMSTWSLDQNLYGFVQSSLNCLPGAPPNALYRAMRAGFRWRCLPTLLLHGLLALPATFAALAEYFLSGMLRRGAAMTFIAKPRD